MATTVTTGALVSVIIPTYNRSAFLVEAVDSVLAQTYPVHEVVIVDDGSQEEHRRVLRQLVAKSPVVKVVEQTSNLGRSRARNDGMARSTGDLLLFLDDDDLLDPAAVETAIQCLAVMAPADVSVCYGQQFGDLDALPINPFYLNAIAPTPRWVGELAGASTRLRQQISHHPIRTLLKHTAPINAFVVRRSAIGRTRFAEDLDRGEDSLFWLDLAVKGCRFRYNPAGRVYVRRHQGNSPTTTTGLKARKRVVALVSGIGHHEASLSALRLAALGWSSGEIQRPRVLASLLRFPGPLLKFCCERLVRKAYRLWLRTTAFSHVQAGRHRSPVGVPGPQTIVTARR
jgi:hypothetical protein